MIFRIVGIILFVSLLVWIVFSPSPPFEIQLRDLSTLGLGNAFDGDLQLPRETIEKAFSDARQRMLDTNSWGQTLRRIGEISAWLSFAATAAITLILGFFGQAPAAGAAAGGHAAVAVPAGLPGRVMRMIGALAAAAAVLTALSNLSTAKSQDYFKRVDEIKSHIVKARQQIIDAPDAPSAQAVLDELMLKT